MGIAPDLRPGERIGDLRVERRIGAGAFGAVFLAHDDLIGRDVALKVLAAGDRARGQALREARAIGRLNHPNIATLHSVRESEELRAWLFEIEYVAGGTLEDRLADGAALPPDEIERVMRAVFDALAHAHSRHVVHGDVKPGNILVGDDGSIKLVDFGLARFMGDVSMALSESDRPGGTPLYMPPEVFMGQEPTPRSDVWSLGVLAYRLITGRVPFRGRGFQGLFQAVLNREPEPLHGRTPAWLCEVAERCLRKDPMARPATAAEIRTAARPPRAAPEEAPPAPARIGQGDLLQRTDEAVSGLAKGRGAVLVVSGAAGAGKSTLLRSLRTRCRRAGARWIESAVSPLHGFQRPFLAALQEAVGIAESAGGVLDVSASTEKLVRALYGGEARPPLDDRLQLYWMLESVLRKLASQSPLCIAIEDAHAADEEDLELIQHLALYLPQSGVLLAVTFRADDGGDASLEKLLSISDVRPIAVEPLAGADLYALIEDRFGSCHIEPAVLRRVASLSQGNPQLCGELVRYMTDSGAAVVRGGRVVAGPHWEDARMPRRLRDLAAARLANLDEDDRHLLDIAAVDGVEFDGRAAAAVTGRPLLEVMRCLQRICRERGVIRAAGNGYRFASPAIREAIYTELSSEMKRAVHRGLAEHLESRREPVGDARIGTHWKCAGEPERAVVHLRRAVAEAIRRFEHTRAVSLAADARLDAGTLPDADVVAHAELLLDLARVRTYLGQEEHATATIERVEEAARAAGEEQLSRRARVRKLLARYRQRGRDHVDLDDLRETVDALGDGAESAEGLHLLGSIAKYEQRYGDAIDAIERAIEVSRRIENGTILAKCLNEMAGVKLRRGELREAEALFHDAARVAEHAGQRVSAAASRVNAVIAAFARGELDGLAAVLRKVVRTLPTPESPATAAGSRIVLANVLWSMGETGEADRVAAHALDIANASGHLGVRTGALRIRAEIAGSTGDLARAWEHYEEAVDLLRRSGNRRIERTVRALAMRFHLWGGSPGDAAAEIEPCLEQMAVDAGEAAPIALDLGEGILYGLPAPAADRVLEAVRGARGSTPEMDAAREFVELAHAWRGGARDLRVEALLDRPLAYRRAQVHAAARLIALGTDPPRAAADRLLADVGALNHVWLRRLAAKTLRQEF